MLQVAVLSNHQSGRDTHVRLIKVWGPPLDALESGPGAAALGAPAAAAAAGVEGAPKGAGVGHRSAEFAAYMTVR
jgi:hypothetical protein